jgi:hypothetical protein
MNEIAPVITSATIAMLVLEGIKWITRKWIVKDPAYDFPMKFYLVMLPILNLLAPYAIWLVGQGTLPVYTWQTLLQSLGTLLLQSLISVGGYNLTVKPLKTYYYSRIADVSGNAVKPVD